MPKDAKSTRDQILKAAYGLFRRKGFTRVSMDEIAASAGITKKTLYYHFRSKDALFSAMFEDQHRLAMASTQSMFDRARGNPRHVIESIFSELVTWSSKPRWSGSGFTRVAIELADLPGHPARSLARRHKTMIVERLGELFAAEKIPSPLELARSIYLLAEGAITMILVTGDQGYAMTALNVARKLVRQRHS